MTQYTDREVRSVIIFWVVVFVLVVGAFAADGLLKKQTCISAMVMDNSTTTYFPEVCR